MYNILYLSIIFIYIELSNFIREFTHEDIFALILIIIYPRARIMNYLLIPQSKK